MVMGAFIPGLRRKYPVHEYISALLLVVGLIFFTLADANTSPNFSIIGVAMISGALIMDSFLGNLQEAIFTMNPDTTQVDFTSFYQNESTLLWSILLKMFSFISDGDAVLLNCGWFAFPSCTNDTNRRALQSMEILLRGKKNTNNLWKILYSHSYIYGVCSILMSMAY